jgi:hypothetical protein
MFNRFLTAILDLFLDLPGFLAFCYKANEVRDASLVKTLEFRLKTREECSGVVWWFFKFSLF